jgi:signal transduction histidine kinase
VFVIIILPVNYVIYLKVQSTLSDADTKELRAEAEKIAGRVTLDPPVIPLPPLGYSLKLQQQRELYFEEVFTSPGFPSVPEAGFLLDSYEDDTMKMVSIRNAVTASTLIVSLARGNSRLKEQRANLRVYLFAANAAAIALAGVLVFMSAGLMLRPIEKIIQAAEGINASNSIERVPIPQTRDESRQLAETLNSMLSRMEASIKNQINFFASATHELKTPLAVMQAELSLALARITDSETRTLLESQLAEVQRLDRIIHDFLLISQLKSETLAIRPKPESFEEVVFAAIKKIKYRSQERGSSLMVTVEETTAASLVSMDFDKMETVIANLMENAVLYSPAGSKIEVVINAHGVRITNPVASPTEDIDSLTSEFKRSNELSSGLGMGLWLSDKIVKLHDAVLTLSETNKLFTAEIRFKRS